MTSSLIPRQRLRQRVRAALAGTAFTVAAPGVFAATITVDSTADGQGSTDCTLRNAITSANNDAAAGSCAAGSGADTIVFTDALAGSTITLNGMALPTIVPASMLAIGAMEAAAGMTIDANQASRIFTNQGNLTLNGLTLVNGSAPAGGATDDDRSGGAVLNDDGGVLTVNGGAMNNNSADRAGGAIEEASATAGSVAVTLNGVNFSGNSAGVNPGNGGVLHVSGAGGIVVSGGTFDGNTAALEGGALWNGDGTMTVTDAVFSNNSANGTGADDGGGAIFVNGGSVNVGSSVFTMNTAGTSDGASASSASGGAILVNEGTTLVLSDSAMRANGAQRAGGAIEVLAGSVTTLDNVTATGNNAGANPGNGGVVHVSGDGDVDVIGGLYANNTAVEGGAFWNNQGDMSFDGVSILGNEATGADATQGGGAIYAETNPDGASGTLTIVYSRIANNTASGMAGSGGAILVSPNASASISDSRIAGNSAQRAGGGIENAGGRVTLTRVMLGGTDSGAANDAGTNPGNGGGLHIGDAGTTTITRSSVGYNNAVEGGGLWNSGAGTLSVDNSTVSNNTASSGAGVYLDGAGGTITLDYASVTSNIGTGVQANTDDGMTGVGDSIRVSNSLVANNDRDLGDGVTASTDDGNVTGSVSVGAYRLFGGTTATQPLTAMSTSALDANDNCGSGDTDQRGAPRGFDVMDSDDAGLCDAGAFELTDDPVLTVTATSAASVTASASDATSVVGFTLANGSDAAATVAGFSGYIERGSMDDDPVALDNMGLAGVALTVHQDSNANGQLDAGETPVGSGQVSDSGSRFTVAFDGGGASIPAMDRTSYVVTADLSGTATDTVVTLAALMPVYAGGALLGLVGLLSIGRVRRRTQLLLIVISAAVVLTACSDSNDVGVDTPSAPMNGGGNGGTGGGDDVMTIGQFQFVVQSLIASATDDLVIGDNLPIKGSVIMFADEGQASP